MLTSETYQLTAPHSVVYTTLAGNAADLLAQSGAKKVGLCLQEQAKAFTFCSGIARKRQPTKAILPTSSSNDT